MDNRDLNSNDNYGNNWEEPRGGNNGKAIVGLLLIVIGLVILATKLNYFFLPSWVFTWPVFLIALGLFIGFRHNFRKMSWLVLVIIGGVFLLNDLVAGFNLQFYFWPTLLIGIGLWVILKPKGRYTRRMAQAQRQYQVSNPTNESPSDEDINSNTFNNNSSTEDYLDSVAIFGGVKKNIISKNFRGGEVVSVFGGTELNMSRADLQQPAVLEATQIFGGTTLIIPANWEVKSEAVAILGGIDDKRPIMPSGYDPNKVLIIKGFSMFGGLQLKSY